MFVPIKYAAAAVAVFAAAGAAAYSGQTAPQSQPANSASAAPSFNLNVVVLDPAHGGPETGATLGDHFFEKDVTLAFAGRLRTALSARGFTVVSTRVGDPAQPLSTDQRAEIASRAHAISCVIIHATRAGAGVHLFTSKLQPPQAVGSDEDSGAQFVPVPWETAQAASVDQSLRMAADVRAAISAHGIAITFGRASLAPLDNMMCPAVALEIAPPQGGTDAAPIRGATYQDKIVDSIVSGLTTWRKQVTPPPDTATQSSAPGSSAPKPKVAQ